MDTPGSSLEAGSDGEPLGRLTELGPRHLGGPELTPRDVLIVRWIARHGVVTPEQVAAHFFERDNQRVGTWAAYRRLRALETLRLIRRDRTYWRAAHVLRVTEPGARLASAGLGPAHLVLAEIRHTLALVDLLEGLHRANPGSRLTTEREIRAQRWRERRDGARNAHRRVPDGLLTLADGTRIAVELDLTPKRARDIETIVRAYIADDFDAVRWYVPPARVTPVSEVVDANRAADLITVLAWEER